MENLNKINFILPGFLNISRNEIIINIYENHNHITTKNSKIHSFFGCFPSAIWNGGRLCLGKKVDSKYMKKVRDFHNKHNIAIALTFTNLVLKEEHIKDKYCNKILKVFHNGKNEVLVSSNCLEKYIRDNFKNYKINKSITSTSKIGYDAKNYSLTVLAVKYTNDFKYMNNISFNDRKKLEILCNEPCVNDCKYKYIHYRELNHIQLGDAPPHENRPEHYARCRYLNEKNNDFFYYLSKKTKFYVSTDDITSKYLPLGITHFKINGREKNQYYGYENIVDYCIKNEFKYDVLCYMLERFYLEYELETKNNAKKYGFHAEEDQSVLHDYINGKI